MPQSDYRNEVTRQDNYTEKHALVSMPVSSHSQRQVCYCGVSDFKQPNGSQVWYVRSLQACTRLCRTYNAHDCRAIEYTQGLHEAQGRCIMKPWLAMLQPAPAFLNWKRTLLRNAHVSCTTGLDAYAAMRQSLPAELVRASPCDNWSAADLFNLTKVHQGWPGGFRFLAMARQRLSRLRHLARPGERHSVRLVVNSFVGSPALPMYLSHLRSASGSHPPAPAVQTFPLVSGAGRQVPVLPARHGLRALGRSHPRAGRQ